MNDLVQVDPATGVVPPTVARPPAALDLDGREHFSPMRDSYANSGTAPLTCYVASPAEVVGHTRACFFLEDGGRRTVDATAYRR